MITHWTVLLLFSGRKCVCFSLHFITTSIIYVEVGEGINFPKDSVYAKVVMHHAHCNKKIHIRIMADCYLKLDMLSCVIVIKDSMNHE